MPTRIGQIAQEIARMNPWWRSPDWAEADHDLREVRDSGLGTGHRAWTICNQAACTCCVARAGWGKP